jgi:5-methylcytosine-specific restriction endonuclease McrA
MDHQLSQIDEDKRTATCSLCGSTRIKLRDKSRKAISGRWRCAAVHKRKINKTYFPYRIHKKDACELCNFKPVHSSQLDVDHIDGNRKNNDPSNLQTLCSNCHRLKTYLNRDWETGNL